MTFIKRVLDKKFLFPLFTFAFLCTTANAQNFRVKATNILSLPSVYEKNSVKCGVNEAVAIKLPSDLTFIQGIEISIKVPQIVTKWTNSVTWSIFDQISPIPSEKQIDYYANRIAFGVFGMNHSLNLKLPISQENNIKKDAYSVLIEDLPKLSADSQGNAWIFLRTQLAMKGTDDELLDSQFEVSARPILYDKGFLKINTIIPENSTLQKVNLQIDGKNFELNDKPILLQTGTHLLSFQSEFYRNELRSVIVEQAKTVILNLELRDITPAIRIAAPEGTKIFIDDNEVENSSDFVSLAAGDHIIKFIIGNYEITKALTTVNGKNYNINISLDAIISEEN